MMGKESNFTKEDYDRWDRVFREEGRPALEKAVDKMIDYRSWWQRLFGKRWSMPIEQHGRIPLPRPWKVEPPPAPKRPVKADGWFQDGGGI